MVATVGIRATQGWVNAITSGETPGVDVSQAYVAAIASFPAENVAVSQSYLTLVSDGETPGIQTSQGWVTVVARGRIYDPKVRVWTFTLDGHDYYVVRLGNDETLVYDLHSQQWYTWGTGESDLWRAYNGINWQGAEHWSAVYGSNVAVGDDGNGAIYLLNPEQPYDEDANSGSAKEWSFKRVATGFLAFKGYKAVPCYGVELMGSIGQLTTELPTQEQAGSGIFQTSGDMDTTGADTLLLSGDAQEGSDSFLWLVTEAEEADYSDVSVTLSYSDDKGASYTEMLPIVLTPEEYDTRVTWRSLGSMRAPGRIFRITDFRALQRIDSLNMPEE